ncbi:MAG: DNA polymerase, partial [bacterium]
FYNAYMDENDDEHKLFSEVRSKKAKQTNFGVAYMAQAKTLARTLMVSEAEGQHYKDSFDRAFPRVPVWQFETIQFAEQNGYVETCFGTRRHATNALFSGSFSLQSRMERQLVNFCIQGTAANQLSRLLSDVERDKVMERFRVPWMSGIHDEVLAMVPFNQIPGYINKMVELMTKPVPNLGVPMEVDVAVGFDWENLHGIALGAGIASAVADALNLTKEIA